MRAFLIDFENVKSAGLVGIETLGIDDQVVILYSANSNTISFEMHQKIMTCEANVEYYQIRRGGKNSLDFQLSSLLGFLLASGLYTHLYVISNDSGFDALYEDDPDAAEALPEEEEDPELRREARLRKFRIAAGIGDLGAVLTGAAVILVLVAFLISMLRFVSSDFARTFSLWKTQLPGQ